MIDDWFQVEKWMILFVHRILTTKDVEVLGKKNFPYLGIHEYYPSELIDTNANIIYCYLKKRIIKDNYQWWRFKWWCWNII